MISFQIFFAGFELLAFKCTCLKTSLISVSRISSANIRIIRYCELYGFIVCSYFLYKYPMANTAASIKPDDRARVLITNREAKMAQSAHAYVRGNTGPSSRKCEKAQRTRISE
jgi:hypothetical protein